MSVSASPMIDENSGAADADARYGVPLRPTYTRTDGSAAGAKPISEEVNLSSSYPPLVVSARSPVPVLPATS